MKLSFDPAKRDIVLADRNLDVARAGEVFADFHLTRRDPMHSTSSEPRRVSVGLLDEAVVIVVWTQRGDERRVITMWKANGKERAIYHRQREQYG